MPPKQLVGMGEAQLASNQESKKIRDIAQLQRRRGVQLRWSHPNILT
jgi:hypothetical protein